MPRATFPPTPEASTEIFGKDSDTVIPDESTFALPPSAIGSRHLSSASSTSSKASDSSYVPNSPSFRSTHKDAASTSRRKASIAAAAAVSAAAKDDFALPPPPTRKRKIIQMHPSGDGPSHSVAPTAGSKTDSTASAFPAAAATPATTSTAGTKRKASGTSAGRKVARKTAHSLIERRRRSKMNEEFAVLKNMIPACAGQEMHKLAILQASTEYLRYLEQCIVDLKANSTSAQTSTRSTPFSQHAHTHPSTVDDNTNNNNRLDDSSSEDEVMADDDNDDDDEEEPAPSAAPTSHNSPAILATSQYRSPSLFPHMVKQHTYPATPPASGNTAANHANRLAPAEFTFTPLPPATTMQPPPPSPAGAAVAAGFEEEASAALLMLNKHDRRVSAGSSASASSPLFGPSLYPSYSNSPALPPTVANTAPPSAVTSPVLSVQSQGRRGMSVRDLLSH